MLKKRAKDCTTTMREIVAFETMHVHPPCPIWSPNCRPFTFYVHTEALETTRQRGACREDTERGQPGGGKDNANSHPAASNGKIKTRERAYRKKKEGTHLTACRGLCRRWANFFAGTENVK